jgi:hypothetical protein
MMQSNDAAVHGRDGRYPLLEAKQTLKAETAPVC